jgi:hypothetical protein
MAFLQLRFENDPDAEDFINIGNPVGLGKPNTPNDVLVVQALLAINFNGDNRLKKRMPGNRPVVVSSKLGKDTPTLIAIFQSVVLKRPKPQGFCNQAPATASKEMDFNTLFRLWSNAVFTQIGLSTEDLLPRLQREHPSLQNLPRRASELVVGH